MRTIRHEFTSTETDSLQHVRRHCGNLIAIVPPKTARVQIAHFAHIDIYIYRHRVCPCVLNGSFQYVDIPGAFAIIVSVVVTVVY